MGVQLMMSSSRLWVVSHDQYVTGKEIGRGAWATVHEATLRGTTVAVKCLHNAITALNTRELFQEMALISQHKEHRYLSYKGRNSSNLNGVDGCELKKSL